MSLAREVDTKTPPPFERDLLATAALSLYSATIAIGFARVFGGWSFLGDLLLIVVVGHGGSFVLRQFRVTGWLAVPVVAALLGWMLLASQYWATFEWGLPSRVTWNLADLEVELVRQQFQTAVAPVIYGIGWALMAGLAMVLVVILADAFAFRAEARGEALVPGVVLFIFIAALGSPRLRIITTISVIAAGIVAVTALRHLHDRGRRTELSAGRGSVSLALPAAVATAVIVATLAGFVGPRLPGAQAEPLYETRGRGSDITQVVSPLVDIRSRLTSNSDVELFRVNADRESYWRATTLPEFDGRTFRLPSRPLEPIASSGASSPLDIQIRQQLQIVAMQGELLPVAADPFQAVGERADGAALELRLNRDTSTLLTPGSMRPGDLYTVVSARPDITRDLLRDAGHSDVPDDIFLELPDDMPRVVAELAAAVTAGSPSTYDAAIVLQSFFRDQFRYSLEVQAGHGNNAIESFLQNRVGYCEQFAATYAAMARTLGIPSRVAVGYTPGILGADGWYSIRGKNAHAWPELWFDGIGWVAFEPTPGRGAPGAEGYTDVPPEQDDSPVDANANGAVTDEGAPVAPTTPSTVVSNDAVPTIAPPATDPDGAPIGDGATDLPDAAGGAAGGGGATEPEPTTSLPWGWLLLLALVGGALALPWAIRALRLRAIRHQGPEERVGAAWRRARGAAERAGVDASAAMTSTQWSEATAQQLPVAARPMASLADIVDRFTFAPPDRLDLDQPGSFGITIGDDCELWADQIDRIASDRLTGTQKVTRYFTDLGS